MDGPESTLQKTPSQFSPVPVVLHFYNLGGIEGYSIQVNDTEVSYSRDLGVHIVEPQKEDIGLRQTISLGTTCTTRPEVDRLIQQLSENKFSKEKYNPLCWNSNHFCNEFSLNLVGVNIPLVNPQTHPISPQNSENFIQKENMEKPLNSDSCENSGSGITEIPNSDPEISTESKILLKPGPWNVTQNRNKLENFGRKKIHHHSQIIFPQNNKTGNEDLVGFLLNPENSPIINLTKTSVEENHTEKKTPKEKNPLSISTRKKLGRSLNEKHSIESGLNENSNENLAIFLFFPHISPRGSTSSWKIGREKNSSEKEKREKTTGDPVKDILSPTTEKGNRSSVEKKKEWKSEYGKGKSGKKKEKSSEKLEKSEKNNTELTDFLLYADTTDKAPRLKKKNSGSFLDHQQNSSENSPENFDRVSGGGKPKKENINFQKEEAMDPKRKLVKYNSTGNIPTRIVFLEKDIPNDSGTTRTLHGISEFPVSPPASGSRFLLHSIKGNRKTNSLSSFAAFSKLRKKEYLIQQYEQQPLEEHIRDPVAFEYFEEFITTLHCAENLHFWREVEKLQNLNGPLSEPIMEIYRRFFDMVNSPEPLNLRADHIAEVDGAILEKKWEKTIFDNSKKWILHLMKINTHNYSNSPAFQKYIEAKILEDQTLGLKETQKSSKKLFHPMSLNSSTCTTQKQKALPREKKDKQKACLRKIFNAKKTQNGTILKTDLDGAIAAALNDISLSDKIKKYTEFQSNEVTFEEFSFLYRQMLNDLS